MARFSTVAVLAVVAFCCTGSSALKCHQCNSLVDTNCAEQPSAEKNCPEMQPPSKNMTAVACWKQTQNVEGTEIVARTCGYEAMEDRCYERVGTKKIKVHYCSCSTESCNSASAVAAHGAVLASSLLLAAFACRA